ncbi:MAG: sugar ABC transporter ATP-binding protein [Actinobacteria bacterium]|nr:sugar ABC transporter ATP-binding protein [Actinomycetota bacterium]
MSEPQRSGSSEAGGGGAKPAPSAATAAASYEAPSLQIRNLGKRFGANQVLSGVDLTIERGEFVGLMGPNGAGKSTLIKILDGVYTASEGEILLGGKRVSSLRRSPEVGFIHQDLGLVDDLSISENLRLGDKPMRRFGPILNQQAERKAAEKALARVGLYHAPTEPLLALAPGEKTLVAVARVLERGARLLFVDEATSNLAPHEAEVVVETLKDLAGRGATVIMVTHKLHETLSSAARVVALVDGRVNADRPIAGLDREALIALMAPVGAAGGGEEGLHRPAVERPAREHATKGELLLRLKDVYGGRAGPVSIELHAGEVLGLTGVAASGLHDVGLLAQGALPPERGVIELGRDKMRRALVPPFREAQGGFGPMSVRENLTMSSMNRWVGRGRLVAGGREIRACEEMVDRLSIKPPRLDEEYRVLSGGNKQKVVFGRALLREPDVYVLCEPTRGVDVATRAEIYRLIREIADSGAGVLVVSSDAEDIFAVSDVVGVVNESVGKLTPTKDLKLSDLEVLV